MSTGYDKTSKEQDLASLTGHHVYDADGNKIGTAGSVYFSETSGAPEWVTVKTGLFGTKESFVPLKGAGTDADGVHVAVRKDQVKDAPRIDEDGHLSDTETAELYRHYGLTPGTMAPGAMAPGAGRTGTDRGAVPPQTGHDTPGRQAAPAGQSAGQPAAQPAPQAGAPATQAARDRGRDGQDARHQSVLRSEEQLRAGVETVESGRVRLRKRVVTAQQQITVPVRREEVRVTREPVKPGETPADARMGEEELEVVLHEERPVVTKETVAVERISLDTETIQENREVTDTVRHEEIDIDDGSKRPQR